MLNPIEINFKLDKTIKRAHSTEVMIKSHDINVIEFHITFDGLELTADHTVKVLSVFNDTKSQTKVNCDIVDGKAIYRPDTSIISQYEHVLNYVYVYHGDQSLDVRLFTHSVDSSEIDKTAIKVKTVYDQTYAELLTEFEARLQDYKDSLPQADSVRAEVDVILNKFKTDGDAKLSQYDTDAQQVIADNQTAFNLAESNRQSTYEQAEDSRNQASEQAVVDWSMTADTLLETVEDNESARVDAEATRKTSETDRVSSEAIRKTSETTRVSNESERESAEVVRLANELNRVNAENDRSEFYEGFDGRLGDLESDRLVINNLVPNGNFSQEINPWLPIGAGIESFIELDQLKITTTLDSLRIYTFAKTIANHKYYLSVRRSWSETTAVSPPHFYINNTVPILNLGTSPNEETVSALITSTLDGNQLSIYPRSTTAVLKIDNVTFLDLTEIFGVGNEPTKAEMDELIKITGYFDEITLTQKQLMNWQLKLMRQNRNALIALGGTII